MESAAAVERGAVDAQGEMNVDEMAEEIFESITNIYYPLMVKFQNKMIEIKQSM